MVEVFKTNVADEQQADLLVAVLTRQYPGGKVNFDLDDCDRILRVEANDIFTDRVVDLLRVHGCLCEVLE